MLDYLRDPEIRYDLHIPEEAPEWNLCSDINYRRDAVGSFDIYKELKGKYRMLIYSGDTDGAVPTLGTQNWIRELAWEISEQWRPYYVNGQIAGMVEVRQDETFVFATIHGAGHMAP